MYAPSLRLPSFDVLPEPARRSVLVRLLETLIACDLAYLLTHVVPPLYQAGVRYQEVMPCRDGECWQDVALCLQTGIGNCKELSSWRIAEILAAGGDAFPALSLSVSQLPNGDRLHTYHVQVMHADGRLEDPSRALGMR
jgi:hypothetical protein